eukprot:12702441-Alexandrium_andersonii.AAC.1
MCPSDATDPEPDAGVARPLAEALHLNSTVLALLAPVLQHAPAVPQALNQVRNPTGEPVAEAAGECG